MDLIYDEKTGLWDAYEPYCSLDIPTEEDWKLLEEAIEKQKARKPDYEGDGVDDNGNIIYDMAYCPRCRRVFEVDYDNWMDYCPKGERLMMKLVEIDEDFCTILICAIRYCLGRQTYMPTLVTDFIRPLLPHLDDKTLSIIENDIKNAESYGNEKIDKPIWLQFLSEVEEEICRRKERKEG